MVELGFGAANRLQLTYHFLLAILIGVSLRMTTFPEATDIAALLGDEYRRKTSFLVSFGFTKAISNSIVGYLSDNYGRKLPHTLGWVFGLLLGFLLLRLNSTLVGSEGDHGWTYYILANICLGAQQGWTWTTNIFMFLDIAGPEHRALASGISNSVGYLSSAVTTYAAATLSTQTAFRAVFSSSLLGLFISACLVRDTTSFVQVEHSLTKKQPSLRMSEETKEGAFQDTPMSNEDDNEPSEGSDDDEEQDAQLHSEPNGASSPNPTGSLQKSGYGLVATHTMVHGEDKDGRVGVFKAGDEIEVPWSTVFVTTCWRNKSALTLCLGGLMANLVTSLAWGLVLIWGKQQDLTSLQLANIGSAFTFTKGIFMIFSGYLSDRKQSRKKVLLGGFFIAALGLALTATADLTDQVSGIYWRLLLGGMVIGLGIGSVYCVMTAALSDHTPPSQRASAIGVYKLWRDSGYAFGGLLTGWFADFSHGSFVLTTLVVAGLVLTLVVGILVFYREIPVSWSVHSSIVEESNSAIEEFEDHLELTPA